MGQYFLLVNPDKKEYVDTQALCGSKLGEQMANGVGPIVAYLLVDAPDDGIHAWAGAPNRTMMGRWAGDDVRVVGDYASSGLYDKARGYRRISKWDGTSRKLTGVSDSDTPGKVGSKPPSGYKVVEEVPGWDGDITEKVAEELNKFLDDGFKERPSYDLSRLSAD